MNPDLYKGEGFVPKGPEGSVLFRWCMNCGQHLDLHASTSKAWSLRTCPKVPVSVTVPDAILEVPEPNNFEPQATEQEEEETEAKPPLSPRSLRKAVQGRSYVDHLVHSGQVQQSSRLRQFGDRNASGDEYNFTNSSASPRTSRRLVHHGKGTVSSMVGAGCSYV